MEVVVFFAVYLFLVGPLVRFLLKFAGYAYESWQGSMLKSVAIVCTHQLTVGGFNGVQIVSALVMVFLFDRFLCRTFPLSKGPPPPSQPDSD